MLTLNGIVHIHVRCKLTTVSCILQEKVRIAPY
jgi:hypothetical protein